MADILEYRTNFITSFRGFLPQQKILDLAQRPIRTIVDEMIPRTRISVKHGWRLDNLSSVLFPTPLALEGIMSIACRLFSVLEELAQRIKTEMALHIFCGIDDARRQRLLV